MFWNLDPWKHYLVQVVPKINYRRFHSKLFFLTKPSYFGMSELEESIGMIVCSKGNQSVN